MSDEVDRAERLAGRFDEQSGVSDSAESSVEDSEKPKVLSMKVSPSIYEKVSEKFDELFVEYVKRNDSSELKKQKFYEAIIEEGLENISVEDLGN